MYKSEFTQFESTQFELTQWVLAQRVNRENVLELENLAMRYNWMHLAHKCHSLMDVPQPKCVYECYDYMCVDDDHCCDSCRPFKDALSSMSRGKRIHPDLLHYRQRLAALRHVIMTPGLSQYCEVLAHDQLLPVSLLHLCIECENVSVFSHMSRWCFGALPAHEIGRDRLIHTQGVELLKMVPNKLDWLHDTPDCAELLAKAIMPGDSKRLIRQLLRARNKCGLLSALNVDELPRDTSWVEDGCTKCCLEIIKRGYRPELMQSPLAVMAKAVYDRDMHKVVERFHRGKIVDSPERIWHVGCVTGDLKMATYGAEGMTTKFADAKLLEHHEGAGEPPAWQPLLDLLTWQHGLDDLPERQCRWVCSLLTPNSIPPWVVPRVLEGDDLKKMIRNELPAVSEADLMRAIPHLMCDDFDPLVLWCVEEGYDLVIRSHFALQLKALDPFEVRERLTRRSSSQSLQMDRARAQIWRMLDWIDDKHDWFVQRAVRHGFPVLTRAMCERQPASERVIDLCMARRWKSHVIDLVHSGCDFDKMPNVMASKRMSKWLELTGLRPSGARVRGKLWLATQSVKMGLKVPFDCAARICPTFAVLLPSETLLRFAEDHACLVPVLAAEALALRNTRALNALRSKFPEAVAAADRLFIQ